MMLISFKKSALCDPCALHELVEGTKRRYTSPLRKRITPRHCRDCRRWTRQYREEMYGYYG